METASWSKIPPSTWSAVRCVIAAVVMTVMFVGGVGSLLSTAVLAMVPGQLPNGAGALVEKALTLLLLLGLALVILRPISARVVGLGWRPLVKILAVAVIGMVLLNIVVNLWTSAAGVDNKTGSLVSTLELGKSAANDVMLVLAIAWIGPVMEEFGFRAFLYRPLRDATLRWGRAIAVGIGATVSAAAFAAIHLDPNQISLLPMYVVFGLGCVAAYELTGSLLAPALLHSINNAWAMWSGASHGGDLTLLGNVAIFLTPLGAFAVIWLSGRLLDLAGGKSPAE